MKAELNLNDTIRVRITTDGYQHMADQHNAIMAGYPIEDHTVDYYRRREDSEGYYGMQLWYFMQVFGPVMYLGMTKTYFDLNILI